MKNIDFDFHYNFLYKSTYLRYVGSSYENIFDKKIHAIGFKCNVHIGLSSLIFTRSGYEKKDGLLEA